jgi:hypothetical protein
MTIRATWINLSARVQGLIEASKLAADMFRDKGDAMGVFVRLQEHASAILSDIKGFGDSPGPEFPDAAKAIERVNQQIGSMLIDTSASTDMRQIHIKSAIVILAALAGEITYILRDTQDAIRSRAERAFEHLQRVILVDEDVRQKWKTAYGINEPHCEKLGAIHLLSHAIWAFKVHAERGRTDLVYQDRLTDTALVERVSEGLVLTEWKRYTPGGKSADTLAREARDQAENYAAGVLAGIELCQYRYIILVSERSIPVPDDLVIGMKTYRHINLQVDPQTASKA